MRWIRRLSERRIERWMEEVLSHFPAQVHSYGRTLKVECNGQWELRKAAVLPYKVRFDAIFEFRVFDDDAEFIIQHKVSNCQPCVSWATATLIWHAVEDCIKLKAVKKG